MSSDDPTKDLSDDLKRTTQPTITAVFELVRELKQSVDAINVRLDETNARIDEMDSRQARDFASLNARLDEMESRHARDFAALDARLVTLSEEMKSGFMRLADIIDHNRLHAEADYLELLKRFRGLESRAS